MAALATQHLVAARNRVAAFLVAMCEHEPHVHTQRLFSAAIYGWLLFGTLLLLPYYEPLWGPASLANRAEFDPSRATQWVVHLSRHPSLADRTWVFITGQLFCLGVLLTVRLGPWGSRLAAIGAYVFTVNLFHRTPALLDGGNNLAELLLFYFMVMNVSGQPIAPGRSPWRKLAIASSNAAFWMCRAQIAIVYLTAGLLKLQGPLWQNGMAIYYILQGEAYTHPAAQELVLAYPSVAMLATYATMAFQILFVVLVWWRPARPWLVTFGIGLNLFGIASGMGLLLFGLVMCLAYTAFLPADVAARVRAPWIEAVPLRVGVPARHRRLGAALRWIARVDPKRRVVIDAESEVLVAIEPSTGRTRKGAGALWTILRRFPLASPLLPALALAWYFGIVGWIERLSRHGSSQ